MQIVIPGALPDARTARELIPHLERQAPLLVGRFRSARPHAQAIDLLQTACTAAEFWQLTRRGFTPGTNQNMSSGLGPLHAATENNAAHDPVWLIELVHVSPSRDGAALLPATRLSIQQDQSLALFAAAEPVFADHGLRARAISATRWQIWLPDTFPAHASASPTLVSQTRVNDWWPQDDAARPWRRLVNELQMTWHDHPVNRARGDMGLPPVNSVWLYGGACPSQLVAATEQLLEDSRLLEPFLEQDWGRWLERAGELSQWLTPHDAKTTELVLLGEDRIVTLQPGYWLSNLTKRLPGAQNQWRNWWSPQN